MSPKLLRSTYVVGGMTLVSRITGFIRDIVFARAFGAGMGMDAFVVAFQIPNFLRRLFGEGAFSQAFVPVFSEYHSQRSRTEVRELAARVTGTFAVILLVVTIVGIVAAPLLILLFSAGFAANADQYGLAVAMLRLTFPYLFFISLTALAAGVLNTLGRFAVPAITPVLLNLCFIAAALALAPQMEQPVMGLAIAVFVAGIVQLAFQLPFLAREGVLSMPRWGAGHEGVKRIFVLMLPAIFGSSVAQVNLLIDRHIASWLQTGSISWLYYSDRLMEFPLGVFGIALGTVILPGLSRHYSDKDMGMFSATVDWSLRLMLLIMLPAAVALFMLAVPVISTLFQYGDFVARDTRMASYSVMAYAIGLLGFALVKVLAPAYFSRQDTRTPVRIGVIAMVANVALNLVLVVAMVRSGFSAPHTGLALATGLSALLNAALLYRGLRRREVYTPEPGWIVLLLRFAAANAVMTVALYFIAGPVQWWIDADWMARVMRLTQCVIGGAVVYGAALLLSGFRPHQLRARAAG
ncbi:MAG: murein biosynthesis integral membrane protein MurJ [Gammaproteobacteria bacterium]|nr:murein biosynthesis integral membrane protein MurJ [Gammaproteobacteria bacterium]NNF61676.1 murein biosynthesis integral membrane protein MurJ [Gammaproteobacteria bacterium]NNM20306.1 murein biosynthesis integral membrane protein MurJ [Gammaproteobacteria bacterium]